MTRILTVIGARPQLIKASVVSAALRATGSVDEIVVHTGQHHDRDMSDVFFADLGMAPPAHALGIHGGGHGEMTGRMLIALERVVRDERPDAVLVYGDTNSTLAGALAAVKLHVPVAHVEAGLRSHALAMPEEVNRILTDRISRWLFTPTEAADRNLAHEGVPPGQVHRVGDVMYDVALHHGARAAMGDMPAGLPVTRGQYVLATVHRAENTDTPGRLRAIVDGLAAVARELPVVWPVHPRTRAAMEGLAASATPPGLHLTGPMGYLDMVRLERDAAVIATDSGGVQKEAFFHGVPCVTLRTETEWVELVDGGWNRLAPPVDAATVRDAIRAAVGTRGRAIEPYGSGDAAVRVARRLASDLAG